MIAPGGRLRKESSYDDQSWIQVLTPVDAFFVDPETGVRTMRLSQRRALQRAHQREVLGLLQGRDAAGFQAASAGRSDDGVGEVVHVHFNGMNQVLTLDPGTGRIQSQAFLGWGPQATIGQVERTYTQWESHAGVQMPTAWEARFDGTLLDPRDRRADGYSIDVLGETAADLFSRPKDRRFDVITRKEPMPGKISYLNPEGLHRNPAFTQLVVVSGRTRTAYIGGQNAVDRSGSIVGKGDIGAQAEQVAKNLLVALAAADAQVDQIVKWTVYVVQGQPVGPALGAFQRVFGTPPNPPTISVLGVAGLAHPDFLLDVEAVAVVPEE